MPGRGWRVPTRDSTPDTIAPRGTHALRARRGVSLMEAVISVAIVGMTAVAALEAVGGDMRTAEKGKRAIETEALATSRLQFMNLLTDRELQAIPDSVENGKFDPPLDEYSWKTAVRPLDDQAGVYDVRVTISWATGSYRVKTYAYRRPALATRK